MAIEYFGQQTAESIPANPEFRELENHMWRGLLTVSLAINRRIKESDWDALVAAEADLQSFDRDPEGWLNEQGIIDSTDHVRDGLQDQVSLAIDNCLANSGA